MNTLDKGQHPITTMIGVGLRGPHIAEIRDTRPAISWFEVHPENYVGNEPGLAQLLKVRQHYPISLHGVGLSLGSADELDRAHLHHLSLLIRRTDPVIVSEHLSWSISDGTYLNDLLPLPYTEEALAVVALNVATAQTELDRKILIENPSRYLRYRHSTISEPEFLAEIVRRTGCGLLCDVNNIHVSCQNLGEDPEAYLAALPGEAIGQIHLAGHSRVERHGRPLLIDDHGSPVCDDVWNLYAQAIALFGPVPTLIEWDRQLPDLPVLLAEAQRAGSVATGSTSPHALAS